MENNRGSFFDFFRKPAGLPSSPHTGSGTGKASSDAVS